MTQQASRVVVYTTPTCGYCHAAKRLLGQKGITYDEIDVRSRPDLRSWLVQASRQRTVPQIFINGESIGGYTELAWLDRSGRLEGKLATPASVDNPRLPS